MEKPFRTLLFFALIVLVAQGAGDLRAQEIRRPLPLHSTPDDRAKFLAGLPVPGDSPLYSAQNSAAYFEHMREFGEVWNNFERTHFSKQRQWIEEEMFLRVPPPRVLYYMFSGPDFINATALFPDCETYILVGLESVGNVPPPEELGEEQIAEGLANLRNSTDTTLKFSFFITKDMKVDLERTDFRGVLPILYAFLSISGNTLLSSEPVSITAGGTLREGTGGGLPGVRIRFSRGPETPVQTLFYIRADLSDAGLNSSSAPLTAWMRTFPSGMGYLKAASYLMHESYFSRIRSFLLDHCNAILQDDSGIPLSYFPEQDWRLIFYGQYTRPIEIFDKKFQPALRDAYERRSVEMPLPFGTGYNYKPGESNLMLAVKRNIPTPTEEPLPMPVATPEPLQRGQIFTP